MIEPDAVIDIILQQLKSTLKATLSSENTVELDFRDVPETLRVTLPNAGDTRLKSIDILKVISETVEIKRDG